MIKFDKDDPRIVLMEGKNDCCVALALCAHHDLPETIRFFDCGSDTKLLRKTSALIANEAQEVLGIVLDADDNPQSRWDSIRSRLEKAGYENIPSVPNTEGTIIEKKEGLPRIGVWIMPDNQISGMLEDFCIKLAPEEAMQFSGECVKTAEEKGFSSFIPSHRSKAEIHTYLAWQNEPGRPLGQAITAKCLDPNHPIANQFVDFLKRLFS